MSIHQPCGTQKHFQKPYCLYNNLVEIFLAIQIRNEHVHSYTNLKVIGNCRRGSYEFIANSERLIALFLVQIIAKLIKQFLHLEWTYSIEKIQLNAGLPHTKIIEKN